MSKQRVKIALPKLWDDLSLRPYLGEIRRRHGIVETIALPAMRDLPPLQIEALFVSPLLAENPVSADSDPKSWPAGNSLLETLNEHSQLIVLGDPGGGKTTLSNWLAWRLSAGLTEQLLPVLDDRVPLPCVLREMPPSVFTLGFTLSELAETIAVRLLGDKADNALKTSLRARIEAGSYVLILDGVDEIPIAHRKVVADWIAQAHKQNACVLATSRIVGYEDGPVDRLIPDITITAEQLQTDIPFFSSSMESDDWSEVLKIESQQLSFDHIQPLSQKSIKWAQIRYLMPFDQKRIAAFAENWYRQRCGTELEAKEKAGDLLASLAQSDVIRQLARTPNLLSLMAIVHRERAHLPDGKALLYDEIANAYINTIDKQRKIEPGDALAPYGWKDRKAWLAFVGFQMQELRGNPQSSNNETDTGVLANEEDVLKWLTIAMTTSGVKQPEQSAQTFLIWVARRSGLLLPRGDKRYAFVHLSFQEYFCACYLDARIASRAFIHNKLKDDDPVTRPKLAEWSTLTVWREALVYLFELQSAEREADWVDDLAEILFKTEGDNRQLGMDQAALAARVLSDRHIRLGETIKDELADRCCQQATQDWETKNSKDAVVLPALVAAGYAVIVAAPSRVTDKTENSLWPTINLTALKKLKAKARLQICIVTNKNIKDVSPLAKLSNLKLLILNNTQVEDVKPISRLNNLKYLHLDNTQVSDIASLSRLKNLQHLHLDRTQVSDITSLPQLKSLQYLLLNNTQVSDIASLKQLKKLKWLGLKNTQVANITPLSNSKEMIILELNDTRVVNIEPLSELKELMLLSMNSTQVIDVTPLFELKYLIFLNLNSTQVIDVTPLSKIKDLQFLHLNNTPISDISPLAELKNLHTLNINGTQVMDVAPLARLKNLRSLGISNTKVSDVAMLADLKNLDVKRNITTKKKQIVRSKKRKSPKKK